MEFSGAVNASSASGHCCWGSSLCASVTDCHSDAFCDSSESACTSNCAGVWCASPSPTPAPAPVPPAPSPTNACSASLLAGVDCYGDDIAQHAGSSVADCCSSCDAMDGCFAFTLGEGTCYLKSACTNRTNNVARSSGVFESYSVASGSFNVSGYQCGDRSPNTKIWYPDADGPFNVIVYGHGSWGGIDCGSRTIEKVAGVGLIVIAPDTQGHDEVCSDIEWQDMILALRAARTGGSALHPALGKADWSRTGVWGYSMGGKTLSNAAIQPGFNIKAMLAFHGARNTTTLDVPAMFTTGSSDTVEGPAIIRPQFESDPFSPKVYANLKGADHLEPENLGRLNIWGARFLACHVGQRQRQCNAIYGTGPGTICAANSFAECIVDSGSQFPAMV